METLFVLSVYFLGGYLLSPLVFILIGNLSALLTLRRYEKIYDAYGRTVFDNIFEGKTANLKKQTTQLHYLSKKKFLILKLFVYV